MTVRCKCCLHPSRPQLDAELAIGTRLATLSRRYGLTMSSLYRHRRRGHIPAAVIRTFERAREMSGVDLERLRQQVGDTCLFGLSKRRAELEQLMARALEADQGHLAVAAAREAKDHDIAIAKLCGEMTGQVKHEHTHLYLNPEWQALRRALLELMRRRPDIRGDLAQLIRAVEGEVPVLDGVRGGGRVVEGAAGAP